MSRFTYYSNRIYNYGSLEVTEYPSNKSIILKTNVSNSLFDDVYDYNMYYNYLKSQDIDINYSDTKFNENIVKDMRTELINELQSFQEVDIDNNYHFDETIEKNNETISDNDCDSECYVSSTDSDNDEDEWNTV
jgi:hypothetical protein